MMLPNPNPNHYPNGSAESINLTISTRLGVRI